MITCHQCGSEVAENDAFCPYCGISLQPVAVPAEEDEFASTIIMPPAESAQRAPSITPEHGPIVDAVEVPEPEPEKEQAQAEPEKEADPVSHFSTDQPDYNNIPTPPALAELERADTEREDVSVQQPVEHRASNFSEPDDYPTISSAPIESHQEVSDSSGSVGDESPADSLLPDEQVAKSTLTEPQPISFADAQDASTEPTESQDVPEISKPDQILEVPDQGSAASMFDSVRIIDDRYTPTGTRPPEQAEPEPPPSSANDSERISKSHTASGMGMVDTDGRRSAKLKPLEEGTVLNGRYEIVRKIGGGGMGAVYLASDNNLGGVLRAVKEMVQAHIEEEQQAKAIEDFRRESVILSQLDHPSIPTIYDYFFDAEECRFYLVMKYISGGDLSARLRAAPEGKIDEKSVTEWGIQLADVLDYLHNQPTTIVYRDLKPSNIMIDGNTGRVMLIDFGIARSINQKEEKGVTAVGTMGYAPPELFSGNVEPRSDIYSLGSTMFHLLTGADPQSNPLLIFDFQKNPRPRQINPQLSDQIERFIMRSVEYNASARFESAAEVKAVLTEHLANLNKGAVSFGVKEAPESVSLSNQPVFCGFCGQRIVATDLFCAFCGAKQPIAQKGVHSEIYGKGAITARLLVEGTSELQSPVFSLEKGEILIGRRDPMSNIFPEVDLSKYDPQTKISRRHARIWREGNAFLVEDLGSSNGTVLMPIVHDSFRLSPRQPHALSNGDKIKVGDTTLHFVVN
jgi:tRNA A-37 threonylcarbamoyl transferase component Bud32